MALYYKSVSLAESSDRAKQDEAIKGFNEIIDKLQSDSFTDDAMWSLGLLHVTAQGMGCGREGAIPLR